MGKAEDTLLHFAHTSSEITALMGRSCESLGGYHRVTRLNI